MREVRRPQQSGSRAVAALLVVFVAMFFGWYGAHGSAASLHGTQQVSPAAQAASAAVGVRASGSHAPAESFGSWGVVAKPMLFLLGWVHAHVVGNWGWAIVVLTFLINLGIWPTRLMSLKSMLKMQRIQPRMDAIKARYKGLTLTDPRRQEMQREIVELQKAEGVSMFGGCLPALIPWPLLVGFYKMLAGAVALRGASWLWVRNLAVADPFHVLPVLVVLTMAASQMLTPTPGVDAKQQRVMAVVMPLMFGFFAWKYPAGLALYFVCSNVFGALQQVVMNGTADGRELGKLRNAGGIGREAGPLRG